ncbi:MAG: glycoside hydrolase family 57 protein [Elusimicrobiota bacterium]
MKTYLAFLWHHHQPMYRDTPAGGTDPSTGHIEYAMPWARLHATKDYYDTAAILKDFPSIKMNFNLVPSLLVQLDEYARGLAYDKQIYLTLKPAGELTQDEKVFVLHSFFMANRENMIEVHPRYRELLHKRGKRAPFGELSRIQGYFSEQDFRDLQVWFNLSWLDRYWRQKDDFLKYLQEKGRNFTEEEKFRLINKHREICGSILTIYRELQDKGQIEVSMTPFYHPILPLVYNTDIAKISMPGMLLPKKFSRPEDVVSQVTKAVEYYEKIFGRKPQGMWPSEGSVSEDIVPVVADAGIKWIATDEEILFNTIRTQQGGALPQHPRQLLYQPYMVEKHMPDGSVRHVNIIFRDRALSDAIGFVYNRWNPVDAANDFISRIHQIRNSVCKTAMSDSCLVSVILDGENCWETYPNDGWDFLKELYSAIQKDRTIETVTISEFMNAHPPKITLKHLFPGSWINANFGIWIGHPEDNLAWEYLAKTRDFLEKYVNDHPEKKDSPGVMNAFEEIYIAEGSDWCWWYGDDHTSGMDDVFDSLFRKHLMNVYKLLGEEVPDELHVAIRGKFRKEDIFGPRDFITPAIDGKITNYFEWLAAGFYETGHRGGTMHQVESIVSRFYYGFDMENLYIRIDPTENGYDLSHLVFEVVFLLPEPITLSIKIQPSADASAETGFSVKCDIEYPQGVAALPATGAAPGAGEVKCSFDKIIEVCLPFELIKAGINKPIEFLVAVKKSVEGGALYEIEKWPYQESVKFVRPTEEFAAQNWSV